MRFIYYNTSPIYAQVSCKYKYLPDLEKHIGSYASFHFFQELSLISRDKRENFSFFFSRLDLDPRDKHEKYLTANGSRSQFMFGG